MPRKRPSDDKLLAAIEHIRYEFDMFVSTATVLQTGIFGESFAQNAFLESFSVHARALIHFFFPVNPRTDDVLAEDYFDDPAEWADLRGDLPTALQMIGHRVGKEVAHLTYARLDVEPEAKAWNIGDIATALHEIIEAFEQAVSVGRLAHTREWAGS